MGSEASAACGGASEPSEWQRSAECYPASPGVAFAGHRNRKQVSHITINRKNSTISGGVQCSHYLSSRAVARQVLSAQMSLTSVFGMGTGGPSSQSTPTRMDGFLPIFYTIYKRLKGLFGDPYRIRTDVNGVRGRCLNHLTNGPFWCTLRDSNPGPTD